LPVKKFISLTVSGEIFSNNEKGEAYNGITGGHVPPFHNKA
jgi:hypothetical protein